MKAPKCQKESLENDSLLDRELVQPVEEWDDVLGALSTAVKTGGGILQSLKVKNHIVRESKKQAIATVNPRCNEGVGEFFCCRII